MSRYIKPKSVTWWGGVAPIVAGVFLATESVHELYTYTTVLRELIGPIAPSVLINAGVVAIGFRGAVGEEDNE